MCSKSECPHRLECHRWTADPGYHQSYSNEFEYPVCFWDNKLNKEDETIKTKKENLG